MREHGAIIVDGIQQGSTAKCPHCGGHFLIAKSGTLEEGQTALGKMATPRIFCNKCGRLTCGRKCCDPVIACLPFEKQLEIIERSVSYV